MRRFIIKIFLFVILFTFLSCNKKNTLPELVILSPHSPEITREFTLGFTKWFKGKTGKDITLRWLNVGGTGDAIEYVKSRNDPLNPAGGLDLFFGGGDIPFIMLKKMGLLEPCNVPLAIMSNIPKEINGILVYSPDSLWFGAALSSFGIIVNKSVAEVNKLEIPSHWEDLADPSYFGWVSTGDPRYGGTLHVMYEIILQTYGWEKGWEILLRMGANARSFEKSAGIAAKSVALGQSAFGLAIDFYAFAEMDRYGRDRLDFIIPDSQSIINPDGIAMLRNGKQKEAARLFIEYTLSEGQKLWMLKMGEKGGPVNQSLCRMPVDSSLYSIDVSRRSVTLSPFKLKPLQYDSKLSGKRWGLLNDLIASLILSPHSELKCAWKRMIDTKTPESYYNVVFSPGITETEVSLLSERWNSKEYALDRVKAMNRFTEIAVARYAAAAHKQRGYKWECLN